MPGLPWLPGFQVCPSLLNAKWIPVPCWVEWWAKKAIINIWVHGVANISRVFQLSENGFRVSMWEKMMSVRIYWIDIFFIRAENSCWWNVSMVRRQLTTLQCSPQKGKEPSKFSWRTPCYSLAGEREMHFSHIFLNFLNEQYFTESRTLNRLPQLSTP